jgi:phosphoenolpyruvate synthase/pyruvate phosphate dikinase
MLVAIKQHRLNHQVVSWELTKEGIFVTGISESQLALHTQPVQKKTITKLYISTGNPHKHLPQLLPAVDGVGVLRSEYTLAKFGIHPLHLIQTKQKKQLQQELLQVISTYQAALHHKPIIYRSQNFTSSELRQLRYSENYEPAEANPYIGYRGGLQMVRQPQLLQFELEVLQAALEKSPAPLGFMPAFVRTPHELDWILAEVERFGLHQYPHFSVWLQLNTPENILNLRSYPTHKLAGVSINITSLHALLLGVDPDNPEMYEHYAMDTLAVERMLEQLATVVRELQEVRTFTQPLQIHLHLEKYAHDLVALAVKLGYHGITVKPAAAQIAHATILEIEEKQLAHLQ